MDKDRKIVGQGEAQQGREGRAQRCSAIPDLLVPESQGEMQSTPEGG